MTETLSSGAPRSSPYTGTVLPQGQPFWIVDGRAYDLTRSWGCRLSCWNRISTPRQIQYVPVRADQAGADVVDVKERFAEREGETPAIPPLPVQVVVAGAPQRGPGHDHDSDGCPGRHQAGGQQDQRGDVRFEHSQGGTPVRADFWLVRRGW
jgi:hypothetical protein